MKSTITIEQQQAIADYLADHELPKGLGTEESACSIAAINLVLTGELTDAIPDCMSLVIGAWIIGVQDAIPFELRNSVAWKSLLPMAAGTGRERETERLAIILEWMCGLSCSRVFSPSPINMVSATPGAKCATSERRRR